LILSQVASLGQFRRRAPINLWSYQIIQLSMRHITAFRRCTQSKPERSKGAFCDQAIGWSRKMMAFIKNEQTEMAQFARIKCRRIIGNNRNRLQLFLSATEQTDLFSIE